jgi:SAM-dependent methyltransferase
LSRFDDWEPSGRRFDLAFSATAIHWVHPDVRWSKAASVLRPGGFLALATNRTVSESTFEQLYRASTAIHARYDGGVDETGSPSPSELVAALDAVSMDIGSLWGIVEPKGTVCRAGQLFDRSALSWYPWERRYRTDEAIGLFSTYSPYLSLPSPARRGLFSELSAMIDDQFGVS